MTRIDRRLGGREARLYAIAVVATVYLVAWYGVAPRLLAAPPAATPAAVIREAPARVAPGRTIRVRTRSS